MSVFENFEEDNNGEIFVNNWVEWRLLTTGISHCLVCLALDKCWFNENKMPYYPHHSNCHCKLKKISKPIKNITSFAECDITKFTGYIFSPKYYWNGKCDLFNRFGFSINDSQYLKNEYERQAVEKYCNSEYTIGMLNEQGQRINIDIVFERSNRKISFKSGWMVRQNGRITCNTPLGG